VRGGPKTLLLALVALLLAVGLVACGGGDSSSSTAAEAGGQTQPESKSSGASNKGKGDLKGSGEKKSGGSADKEGQSGSSDDSSSNFVPKHHNDSGGGSAPYKVKGGDNSVQEFGEEAGSSEFDAAATALHNFLDARAEGNWAATCDYVSKNIIESVEKLAAKAKGIEDKSCAGILEKLTNPAAKPAMKAEAEQANVRSLRTEGEQAFVLYTGPDGKIFSMPMANEAGAWKVASLSGYPLN
jgi:hypothetical protein